MLSQAKYMMGYLQARRGQGMTEYAVIVALIVIIAIAVLSGNNGLAGAIKGLFNETATAVNNVNP